MLKRKVKLKAQLIVLLIIISAVIAAVLIFDNKTPVAPPTVTVPVQKPVVLKPAPVKESFSKTVPETEPESRSTVEPAWQKNAVQFHAKAGYAKVAIVFDDMGLDVTGTQRAMNLPGPLTMSFMPYAENLPRQTEYARAHHELMLHMPMQPIGRANPGPNALTVDLNDHDIETRLQNALGTFKGMAGVNNHMGSRFTQDAERMRVVMRVLKAQQLFYLDSVTIGSSKAYAVAEAEDVPALKRDVFLDDDMAIGAVRRQLAEVEKFAQRHGQVIAIGHPHANTIAALKEWLPTLEDKKLQLVPMTELISQHQSPENSQAKP